MEMIWHEPKFRIGLSEPYGLGWIVDVALWEHPSGERELHIYRILEGDPSEVRLLEDALAAEVESQGIGSGMEKIILR